MAQPIPKTIKELCTPAAVYFIISFISLFVIAIQNRKNDKKYCVGDYECDVSSTFIVFVIKIVYVLFWTWVLHLICRAGYTKLSWFIVLLPFILMFVLISLLLITN